MRKLGRRLAGAAARLGARLLQRFARNENGGGAGAGLAGGKLTNTVITEMDLIIELTESAHRERRRTTRRAAT